MIKTIEVTEGVGFTLVDPSDRELVRSAAMRVRREIRPKYGGIGEEGGVFKVSGIVGTIAVRPNLVLDVRPKVPAGTDWIHSVLDLLVGRQRVDAGGERLAGLSPERRDLLEMIAVLYAARLERALTRDGPIQVIERNAAVLPSKKGRLNSTEWVRQAAWRPHRFPCEFNRLSSDNVYSRALAFVAFRLAKVVRSHHTRATLRGVGQALRPGLPTEVPAPAGIARGKLPPQWAAYSPAWEIAAALLAKRGLLGASGGRLAPSLAVEAWPLLEQLLARSLRASTSLARDRGHAWKTQPKSSVKLLRSPVGAARSEHGLEPDGRLTEGERTLATFEAKYSTRTSASKAPEEEHRYQALAAAAACGSPLAVVVYPDDFPPAAWAVEGFGGRPNWLATAGLGLFTYRAGSGDEERGKRIMWLVESSLRTPPGNPLDLT